MKLCNKEVSQIGFGTWKMGGGYWSPDYSNDNKYIEIIKYVISKGVNVIDTAEMYGGGHAEELVGKAVKDFDRESIFIITKVWPNHLRYDDLIKSAKDSLRRLDSKYIDLYLIHWPNSSIPLEETIRAMEYLVDQGIVNCIGVSNFDVMLLERAMSLTKKYEIVANEIEYNVDNKTAERDIIPFCERNNIKVIAYSPLSRGNVKNNTILEEIGRKYGKTSVQVALNYLMRRSIPIPKASTKEHVDEILGALGWNLSNDDYDRISKI
ncbi:aldo/keto reductase [Sulfolobus tengchongensis]|uniref:Aldo/keto reductase n=1 Tax=Sulfolobus tengchongensis TaxID=207809 RepID=A0AAX4L004_9CREN